MADEGHAPNPPSRAALLWQILAAAVVAALIVVGFILPAEFNLDPTGFGRLTGLSRLSAPQEVKVSAPKTGAPIAHSYATAWRTDTVDIPLASGDVAEGSELEWKVKMKPGATMVYAMSVSNLTNPEEFYYDFHSQSVPMPKVEVISHEAKTGDHANGSLVAPFEGIHGWYLQNQSAGPVVVHLKLAGFYERMTPRDIREAAEAAAKEFGPPGPKT